MIAQTLLGVVVPVFVVIAVGALLARRFGLDLASVTRLGLYAAVPALVFRTLSSLSLPGDAMVRLLSAYALLLLALTLVAWIAGRTAPVASRRALVGTTLFGNAANMMLPISLFAFGEAGLERALVLYVATALAMFAIGPSLVGQAVAPRAALRTVVRFPVFWAALAGVAASTATVTLPIGIERAVGLLADAAVPLVLLSLGIQMSHLRAVRPRGVDLAAVALKLVVAPGLGFVVGRTVGLEGLDLAVLTLLAGMPTAINLAMLAVEFRGDADLVGRAVVLGTAASLLTLPLVLTLVAPLIP